MLETNRLSQKEEQLLLSEKLAQYSREYRFQLFTSLCSVSMQLSKHIKLIVLDIAGSKDKGRP